MNAFVNARTITAIAGLAGLLSVGSAAANPTAYEWYLDGSANSTDGIFSTAPGAITIDFNSGAASIPGITYSGGGIVSGNLPGSYAPPAGDTSMYFSAGPSTSEAVITLNGSYGTYFGFDFSSPDSYNTIDFFRGSALIASYTGDDLALLLGFGPADGRQTASYFLNVSISDPSLYFTSIVLGSSCHGACSPTNAFETDNHAFITTPIPEPGILSMMAAGLGLMGCVIRRRKRNDA